MRALLLAVLFGMAVPALAQPPVVPSSPPKTEPPKTEPPKKEEKEEPPERPGNPDDVPVVGPKKDKKVDDVPTPKPKDVESPPAPIDGQAVLPVTLVKNTVQSVQVGQTVYVPVGSVRVDNKRRMWVVPSTVTGKKTKDRPVQLRRDADGYHVSIEVTLDVQWEAEDCDGFVSKWVPVRSFQVKE